MSASIDMFLTLTLTIHSPGYAAFRSPSRPRHRKTQWYVPLARVKLTESPRHSSAPVVLLEGILCVVGEVIGQFMFDVPMPAFFSMSSRLRISNELVYICAPLSVTVVRVKTCTGCEFELS